MIYIGIDFSIKSTAVCINDSNKKYIWLSFSDNLKIDNKPYIYHKLIRSLKNVEIQTYDRNNPKGNYTKEQSYKINNAVDLSLLIRRTIQPYVLLKECYIGIEGFSFGSKGNSFIDLITYNTFLKSELIRSEISQGLPYIFSPSTIKKEFTGNGRSDKVQMFKSFKEYGKSDEFLFVDPLYRFLSKFEFDKEIPKPIDDLIDSFSITKVLSKYLSN